MKRGVYFRPRAKGYTQDISKAGKYTQEYAQTFVDNDPEISAFVVDRFGRILETLERTPMEDDEYLPEGRWLDVEIHSCSTSPATRFLPEKHHSNVECANENEVGIAPGKLMRLCSGSTPMIVTQVVAFKKQLYVTAVYYTSTNSYKHRVASDFVEIPNEESEAARLLENADKYIQMCYGSLTQKHIDLVADYYDIKPNPDLKGNSDMSDLYKTNENPPRYGTRIAETSCGRIVLELRTETGTQIADFNEADIERVTPWTFLWNGVHYKAPKDSVSVGDIVAMGSHIDIVKKVNTESADARQAPACARVVQTRPLVAPGPSEPVTEGSTEDTKAET